MANSIVDFIHGYKVRCIDELDPPVLLAEVEGTPGTTSYTYKASFVTLVGESLPSETVVVTTGNATLSGFNKIKLYTTNIPESVTYIRFWKYVSGSWVKIADVVQDPGQLYDTGQATTAATLPVANTSGRKGVIAICPSPGTLNQRMNWMDLQSIIYRKDQKLWDGIHRNGDIIRGCTDIQERGSLRANSYAYSLGDIMYVDSDSQFTYICTTAGTSASSDPGSWPVVVDTTKVDGDATWTCKCTWNFTAGEVYLFGTILEVPAGQVELTGDGPEVVGLTVAPVFTTSTQDSVQRAGFDEGVPPLYANTGPDWLYLELTWVVDEPAQISVKEFLDGVANYTTLPMERTELQKRIAEGIYDVSGHFVTENFSYQVVDDSEDLDILQLKIGRGTAYPKGFKVKFDGTRFISFDKARDVASENESSCDVFDYDGGVVTGTVAETYSLSGKSLKFKVGAGNYHTVSFTSETTAAAVGARITAYIVSAGYPAELITYAATTVLQLRAREGYSLEISAPASDDAAPILGLAAGTYLPQGTRLYQLNNYYIKDVTDMSYNTESVITLTRSNVSDYDGVTDLSSIICVSDTSVDAYDEKAAYSSGVDYQRSVKEVVGVCIDWSLGGSEPVAGATYYAKVKKAYEPTIGTRQKVLVVDAPITKGAEDGIDDISFTSAASITRAAINPETGEPYGTAVSLTGAAKDVISLVRVNNSIGQSATQYTTPSLLKNSGALSHETSQIDWSASGAPNSGVTGQPVTSATYYVTFYAWAHITEGDVVTAASYDSYPDIETFGRLLLRDCLDFRTTGTMPGAGEDPGFDYEYYLARIDKLTIDDFGNFRLIAGTSALSPQTPSDQSGALTLAIVRIPPYTYDKSNVSVISLEPIRITQKGIQRLQERIEKLEYWNAINDLEKEVSNKDLYGLVGGQSTAAEKQGVFTDALTGFGKIDLQFSTGGISHTAAVDRFERCLLLPATQDLHIIDVDSSTHIIETDAGLMLDYQPVVIQEQPLAGITVNGATDFTFENYYGHMRINPETDVFVDTQQLPQLNIDYDNNLSGLIDALNPVLANSIDWGSWSNGAPSWSINGQPQTDGWGEYFANTYGQGLADPIGYYNSAFGSDTTRTGHYSQLIPGSITQELGDRVVDLTLQGKMRAGVTISCDIVGLLPNVDHAVSMNGILCDLTYDSSPTNHSGSVGATTYKGKTTVQTSNTGTLTATFLVPEGIPIGNALICVYYCEDPSISLAWASYYTAGFMQSNQSTTIGIPTVETIVDNTEVESGIVVNLSGASHGGQIVGSVNTGSGGESAGPGCWGGDPLAQTFIIKNDLTYISAVGLYFSTKSATMPYTVQLRNTVNGQPGAAIYSSITLLPEDISISDDSSIETVFTFDHVLGFSPNQEYCIVGIPGGYNTDYNLYCAELGTVDILTTQRIITQPHDGVLFHSPNNRTWEAWTKRDLKFKLYKSNFENDCQIVWTELTGVEASVLVLSVEEFIAPGTNATWAYSLDSGVTWIPFSPGINTDLDDVITKIQLRVDVTSLGGSYAIAFDTGIVLLLHDLTANYIGNDSEFSDALAYPNKVSAFMDLDTDGTNGTGTRSVTPKFSVDNGVTWVELGLKEGYTPVALDDPWYSYQFETPDEASITNATNAEPIVITSAGHGFKDGTVITVSNVEGNTNANGDWVVTDSDTNTFKLYTESGIASIGNSQYTTAGTIVMKEFSQIRPLIYLETANAALTPKVRNIGFIASRVE